MDDFEIFWMDFLFRNSKWIKQKVLFSIKTTDEGEGEVHGYVL